MGGDPLGNGGFQWLRRCGHQQVVAREDTAVTAPCQALASLPPFGVLRVAHDGQRRQRELQDAPLFSAVGVHPPLQYCACDEGNARRHVLRGPGGRVLRTLGRSLLHTLPMLCRWRLHPAGWQPALRAAYWHPWLAVWSALLLCAVLHDFWPFQRYQCYLRGEHGVCGQVQRARSQASAPARPRQLPGECRALAEAHLAPLPTAHPRAARNLQTEAGGRAEHHE
mmetsp:Transcript_79103/g.183551  ORF Transcript_79103/g.183551 Transcript_79103/m.183551 type:complete len:224 (+) Transcript_79103:1077-1748(+)